MSAHSIRVSQSPTSDFWKPNELQDLHKNSAAKNKNKNSAAKLKEVETCDVYMIYSLPACAFVMAERRAAD